MFLAGNGFCVLLKFLVVVPRNVFTVGKRVDIGCGGLRFLRFSRSYFCRPYRLRILLAASFADGSLPFLATASSAFASAFAASGEEAALRGCGVFAIYFLLCVFQDFAGRDAARLTEQTGFGPGRARRLDVGNDTLNHVQFRAGAVIVPAAVEYPQPALGQRVNIPAFQKVALAGQLGDGAVLGPGFADQGHGRHQVAGGVHLLVDYLVPGGVAHGCPQAGGFAQGVADGLDVCVGALEQFGNQADVPVGGHHQRRLDATPTGLGQLAMGIQHRRPVGHRAHESPYEFLVRWRRDVGRPVQGQQVSRQQFGVADALFGPGHAQGGALAQRTDVTGVVGLGVQSDQHGALDALDGLSRDAVGLNVCQ